MTTDALIEAYKLGCVRGWIEALHTVTDATDSRLTVAICTRLLIQPVPEFPLPDAIRELQAVPA